ncbi:MAG: DNA polymerase I [Elusimicrobia bacterium]|nr:DNA polymerase I [Elusimicrobiota bacterium]
MFKKTIFIIDAHAFLHRSYHALPKLSTSKGEEVGALYGFLRLLLKIIKEHKPDYAAVCFDSPGKTFRDELYCGYKANRKETEDGLVSQLKQAPELPGAVGLKAVVLPGYEADDIIATLAEKFSAGGVEVVIVTGDKDAAQLVRDGVKLWDGGSASFSGEAEVLVKFGVKPSQIADFLALTGDSSDNVPGVAGIGPKGAAKLLSAYGALENILAAASEGHTLQQGVSPTPLDKLLAKVAAGAEAAALSKRLCALERNAPVPFEIRDFIARAPDAGVAGELGRRLEFRDLAALGAQAQAGLFDAPLPPEISLDEALARAETGKFLCLASGGGALCAGSDKGAAYIAAGGLNGQDKKKLSAVIADAGILKATAGLKKAMHLLDFDPGVEPRNFFELEIAQSLLSARKADISKMIFERAGAFPHKEGSKEWLLAAMGAMPGLCEALKKELRAAELEKVYQELELPLITVIYAMERAGFGVDAGLLNRLSSDFERRLAEIETEAETLTGHKVNLNSPKQLAWLLYEKLNIQLDDEQKRLFKTKDGYSTAEEALTLLLPAHPVIEKLLEFRELSKLKSSFVDNLLAAADAQGRVHSTFEQTGTSTGRFSSSKPNLQNIPVRSSGGQSVRRAFIAGPGCSLLSADYSQIDLRVLAHVSGDRSLVEAFRADEDIHLRTASEVFYAAPQLVTPEMRRTAKAINFGIVYGQTAQGLARALGIPRSDAAKYIKHYFEVYSGVKAWIDRTVEEARIKGSVYTFTGRRRAVPDITGSNSGLRAFAERVAVNMPIQGGSADIIKKAMIDIHARIKGLADIAMILQVHDELVFEVHDGYLTEAARLIKSGMEGAFKLDVPLKADIKSGKNWQDMEPVQELKIQD